MNSFKRGLIFVGESVRTGLMVVGAITVHDYAKQRWPENTKIIGVVLVGLFIAGFIWCAIIAPFIVGLREGRPTANEPKTQPE
jgi:hypothetical protein